MSAPNNQEKTVLVVENNPDDIYLLDLAAKETCPEISFVFVPDDAEALAYLEGEGEFGRRRTGLPDLLLLDVRLVPRDRFTVVQRIRERADWANLKVLLWTDGAEPAFEDWAMQAGANVAMRKPFSFAELMSEVKRICDLAQASNSPG